MTENENKVNNNEELDVSKREEIDEIMNGFYNLASIYSSSESTRERELREREEKRRSREMEAIKEDIERRYSLHLENAVNEVEGREEKKPIIQPVVSEETTQENVTIEASETDKNKEDNSSVKTKKRKKNVKVKNEKAEFNLDEKNSLYGVIYTFGDIITKIIKGLLGSIIAFLLSPFKKFKEVFDVLTEETKKQSAERIKANAREITSFKKEINSAKTYLKVGLRHPASMPSILAHYIKKALRVHGRLLKTIGNTLLPILSAVLMIFVFNYWKQVTFALEVIYNDKEIGYISDETVFIEARNIVIDRLSAGGSKSELSQSGTGTYNAEYRLALVSLDELNDANTISDRMIENSTDNFTHACGVYIDGEFICAVKNESDAKTVFYSILEPYEENAEKGGYIVGFAEDIDYVQGLYRDDPSVMWEAGKLEDTVLGNEGATLTYTVSDNDTIKSIAYENGTTEEEIYNLNPGLDSSLLHTGTNIFIPSYTKLVNIKKTITSSSVRSVDYDVIKKKDITKYSGYRLVKQKGVNGKERITTTKTYINGELYNTEYSFETIKEPVDEIVVVGSKTTFGGVYIGEASSKGFLWPAPHCRYISSKYGWRSAGWHKGIDLCTGNGTASGSPVIASKSGRVEAVQRSSSGYGNMVLINHGDGYKTRYAHLLNGSITVNVGDYVEGGYTIGRVGSTGNSSGPHLHFEVIYNGEIRDPSGYISQ